MKIREILTEGNWAAPQTVDAAKDLADLFRKPIQAGRTSGLYNLVGDDQLYDIIDEIARDDPTTDVRPAIADFVGQWIKDLNKEEPQWNWQRPWQPEAVSILKKLVRRFGYSGLE